MWLVSLLGFASLAVFSAQSSDEGLSGQTALNNTCQSYKVEQEKYICTKLRIVIKETVCKDHIGEEVTNSTEEIATLFKCTNNVSEPYTSTCFRPVNKIICCPGYTLNETTAECHHPCSDPNSCNGQACEPTTGPLFRCKCDGITFKPHNNTCKKMTQCEITPCTGGWDKCMNQVVGVLCVCRHPTYILNNYTNCVLSVIPPTTRAVLRSTPAPTIVVPSAQSTQTKDTSVNTYLVGLVTCLSAISLIIMLFGLVFLVGRQQQRYKSSPPLLDASLSRVFTRQPTHIGRSEAARLPSLISLDERPMTPGSQRALNRQRGSIPVAAPPIQPKTWSNECGGDGEQIYWELQQSAQNTMVPQKSIATLFESNDEYEPVSEHAISVAQFSTGGDNTLDSLLLDCNSDLGCSTLSSLMSDTTVSPCTSTDTATASPHDTDTLHATPLSPDDTLQGTPSRDDTLRAPTPSRNYVNSDLSDTPEYE